MDPYQVSQTRSNVGAFPDAAQQWQWRLAGSRPTTSSEVLGHVSGPSPAPEGYHCTRSSCSYMNMYLNSQSFEQERKPLDLTNESQSDEVGCSTRRDLPLTD